MLMVKAGDRRWTKSSKHLLPHLETGDIIIDGGNSHFPDTNRRTKTWRPKACSSSAPAFPAAKRARATAPPSCPAAIPPPGRYVKDIFQAIAAKVEDGTPCCDWVGENGAGHYVKMVHNGIEYGDMQLICEAYQLLKEGLGLSADELHEIFTEWNKGELDSYLIEITADIFYQERRRRRAVVDKILDTAGQKGTGKWTGISALDTGHARHADRRSRVRALPSRHEGRARGRLQDPQGPESHSFDGDREAFIEDIRQRALLPPRSSPTRRATCCCAKRPRRTSWNLNYRRHRADVARRLHHPQPRSWARSRKPTTRIRSWTTCCSTITSAGVIEQLPGRPGARHCRTPSNTACPRPAFSTALAFYDGYRTARLPANLLQAQRDFFGAHTYERIDQPRGKFFHTNWTGRAAAAGTYTSRAGRYNVMSSDFWYLVRNHRNNEHGLQILKTARSIFFRWARWSTGWTRASSRSARPPSATSTSAAANSTAPPTCPTASA